MNVLKLLLALHLLITGTSSSAVSNVTCLPSYSWAENGCDQTPCEVAAYLISQCTDEPLHLTRCLRIHTTQGQRPHKMLTNASAVLSFILLCLLVQDARTGIGKTGMYGEQTALISIILFFRRTYQSRRRFQFGPIWTTQISIHSILKMLKA